MFGFLGRSFQFLSYYSSEIISILQEAPANCLPLFKFTEIYEKKQVTFAPYVATKLINSTDKSCTFSIAITNCIAKTFWSELHSFFSVFRYSRKLVVADLYRIPEVVAVREQGGSRLVCLLPSSQIRQSPLGSSQSQEGSSSASGSPVVFEELEYHEPVCKQHYTDQNFR